jgi:uncharacterized membrane protein
MIAPMKRIQLPRLFRSCLVVLVALFLTSACGGGSGSATVTIDSVDPETTYPGVETAVAFSIEASGVSELNWEVDFGDSNQTTGEGSSGEVSHTWESSGQYTLEVTAFDGDTEVGSISQTVRVVPPVDIEVANAQPSPANVEAGNDVTVSVDVTNLSPSPVESPFALHIFFTREPSLENIEDVTTLQEIGRRDVQPQTEGDPALPADTTRTVNVNATVPEDTEPGDYHLVPYVDPMGDISDADPSNNVSHSTRIIRVSNTISELPDIVVENVIPIPDRAYPALNSFSRTFELRNLGGSEAAEVTTKTYLSVGDDQLDMSDRLINESTDGVDVAEGQTVTVGPDEFTLQNDITPMDGEQQVWVIVEATVPGGEEAEANTDNNVGVSDPPITVSDELADGPDIAVNSFSVTPNQTFLDGSLTVSMELANQGNTDVGSFFCGLYLGSEPRVNTDADPRFQSVSVAALASGQTTSIERTVTVPGIYDPGTYNIYVVCDPTGSLEETFRTNNQMIYDTPVEVSDQADVDLYVDSIEVPSTVQQDSETNITVRTCVSGSNPSGRLEGELYETTGVQVDFTEEPIAEFDIPNINPGECTDIDVPITADCEDFQENYAFGAIVDTNNNLPEGDEDNNEVEATQVMTVEGEFCACDDMSYESNNNINDAEPLSEGQYSSGVCNPDTCDYYEVTLKDGESYRVETTFPGDKGALESTAYSADGLTVIDSDSRPDRQQVGAFAVDVTQPTDFPFSVCGVDSQSQNLYDMEVSILPAVSGVDLIARQVGLPAKSSFSIGEDLEMDFRVNNIGQQSSGNFQAQFVISPDREFGDGDDVVIPPQTTSINSIGAQSARDITETVTIPSSINNGDYWLGVQVDSTNQVSEADETNNVAFSRQITIDTQCYDPLEPNDSFQAATSVSDGTYNNLIACAQADDYYEICLPGDKKFEVSANFDHTMGDIDLELYNQQQEKIDSSASTTADTETVKEDYVNGAQCYYVRAFLLTLQPMLETTYSLSVNTQNVAPNLQCDSAFEPNNDFSTAGSLIAATSVSGTLDRCPTNDEDFYSLDLSTGQTVTLRGIMDPSNQGGSLRLQLYNPSQLPVLTKETGPGTDTAEISNFTATTTGTYYLQVTMTGSQRRATYKLESQGLGGIDLSASNLDFWPNPNGYGPGDSVFYDFDLSNSRADTATTPTYEIYLGDSATLDTQSDTLLQTVTRQNDLPGNTTDNVANSVSLPQMLSSTSGYLHVRVVADSSQTDPNPANNVSSKSIPLSPSP